MSRLFADKPELQRRFDQALGRLSSVKVLDLGLAKVFAEGSTRPLATPTATGVMQGTPR